MSKVIKKQNEKRVRRIARTRAKISGTAERPRLALFRSNTSAYVQLIDDTAHKTLAAASTKDLSAADKKKPKQDQSFALGEMIAKKATDLGITKAVFDRRGYQYHGRVKAVAEGARNKGLSI